MKDSKNARWTKKDIAEQYKIENPEWTWKQCLEKSETIYRELNSLNKILWAENRLFFKRNIPFSNFKHKNDEFSNIFFDKDDSEY